jgi:hypothetical protein
MELCRIMHKQLGAQSAHAVGAAEAELDRSYNGALVANRSRTELC